jgi:hypothetical protein
MDYLGEAGFDGIRFSGGPKSIDSRLAVVLPLIIHIPNKRYIALRELSRTKVASIVNACAGVRVKTQAAKELENCIRIDLENRCVRISSDGHAGLRDVILAAVLIRVYNRLEFNKNSSLSDLIGEAYLTLADELPQALNYSGTDDMHCTRSESHWICLNTASEVINEVTNKPAESADFHFQVA